MNRRRRTLLLVVAGVIGLPVLLVVSFVVFLRMLNPVILHAKDEINGTLVSGGEERQYLLYVPTRCRKPAPLVISLHAAALWPATQKEISGWNAAAEQDGFIVVYPSGRRVTPAPFLPALPVWSIRNDAARASDVQFISDLIDALERKHAIDPKRIYVSGFSNGGAMAFVLSCTLPRKIAAVSIVAGAQELPASSCATPAPVPAILFHGTKDPFVPFAGGKGFASPVRFPAVKAWASQWASRNGCTSHVTDTIPGSIRDRFTECVENADVVLYSVDGGGHSWPGGKPLPEVLVGPTSGAVDATALSWAFFREHPLPDGR